MSASFYGKYMIQQSGRFEYDENLDAFYDYEKYGTERMNEEDGMFTDRGYIAYKGYISMEEVMNGGQSSHMVITQYLNMKVFTVFTQSRHITNRNQN